MIDWQRIRAGFGEVVRDSNGQVRLSLVRGQQGFPAQTSRHTRGEAV